MQFIVFGANGEWPAGWLGLIYSAGMQIAYNAIKSRCKSGAIAIVSL